MTFSSSVRRRDSPSSPRVNSRGAWFVADLKSDVAFAAFAAAGRDHLFAESRQIFQHDAVLGVHDTIVPGGTLNDQVFGAATVALLCRGHARRVRRAIVCDGRARRGYRRRSRRS